jgi:hypothetical protein
MISTVHLGYVRPKAHGVNSSDASWVCDSKPVPGVRGAPFSRGVAASSDTENLLLTILSIVPDETATCKGIFSDVIVPGDILQNATIYISPTRPKE